MNHVCVAARTDGSREGRRSSYREYEQANRQSEPPLWLQPFGLARVFAHDFVALLGNIRDIACVGFASWAKIVTAHRAGHYVRHS
jgi:hypothetical protein